jgi:hypothetical protein
VEYLSKQDYEAKKKSIINKLVKSKSFAQSTSKQKKAGEVELEMVLGNRGVELFQKALTEEANSPAFRKSLFEASLTSKKL